MTELAQLNASSLYSLSEIHIHSYILYTFQSACCFCDWTNVMWSYSMWVCEQLEVFFKGTLLLKET